MTEDKRVQIIPDELRAAAETVEGNRDEVADLDDYCQRAADTIEALQQRVGELEDMLRQHHQWHLDSGTVKLGDDEVGWHEVDMAEAYSESTLCDRTVEALRSEPGESGDKDICGVCERLRTDLMPWDCDDECCPMHKQEAAVGRGNIATELRGLADLLLAWDRWDGPKISPPAPLMHGQRGRQLHVLAAQVEALQQRVGELEGALEGLFDIEWTRTQIRKYSLRREAARQALRSGPGESRRLSKAEAEAMDKAHRDGVKVVAKGVLVEAEQAQEQREALMRIAFPEESGVDDMAGNPNKWSSTIAYKAIGGRYRDGQRLDTKRTLKTHGTLSQSSHPEQAQEGECPHGCKDGKIKSKLSSDSGFFKCPIHGTAKEIE